MPVANANPIGRAQRWRAIAAAGLLYLLSLRTLAAEDRFEAKYLWYAETGGRISVSGPSLLAEHELTPWLSFRLEGVYNAVSGASPTGEPAGRRTKEIEVSQTTTTSSVVSHTDFHSVSGPSGRTSRVVADTTSETVTNSVTTLHKETILLADHKSLPLQELRDERYGVNGLFSAKTGAGTLGVGFAYSTERDYVSTAGTLKWTQEFNQKNTVLNAGFSYAHDEAELFPGPGVGKKDSYDWHLGLTQILDKFTLLDLDSSVSSACGYLNDQYKVVLLDDEIVSEQRPSRRLRGTLGGELKRYITPLAGSVEAGYRFGTDTFGIRSHTISLTWAQKLGAACTLSLGLRGYWQNAADFYAVSFSGNPAYYSADYRLSSLFSLSSQVDFRWRVRENWTLNLGYERYAMHGRDHVTDGAAYPTANVLTAGVQVWF